MGQQLPPPLDWLPNLLPSAEPHAMAAEAEP
jgi:hypothetical protein